MTTKVTGTFIDNSREFSSTSFHIPAIANDGSNYDVVLTDVASDFESIQTATALITTCNLGDWSANTYQETSLPITPVNALANRETKVWIQYVDNVTGKYYSLSIPGPIDTIFQQNTDEVDIAANVVFVAWKDVFESRAVSEMGNAVTVVRARRVRGAK